MKNLPLIIALAGLSTSHIFAQEETTKPEENYLEWQKEYLNLPEDRKAEYEKSMTEARKLFSEKRIFEALEELRETEDIFENSPDVANMKGACMVEFRDFDKAMAAFERANELSPNNPTVLFNIGEIYFVTKKWKEAASTFDRTLQLLGDKPMEIPIRRLCEFKNLLCEIKLGNIDKAKAMAGKYDEVQEDTPFPYYAEAAILFHEDDRVGAQVALARAKRVFANAQILAPWHDTLMEFGYIPSFYGGILEEEEQ